MKMTLLLILCSLLQVKAEVNAQRRVSMQMKEVTLDKVFRELSRQVNCEFLYNHSVVKQKGRVTVEAKDQELKELLDNLLSQLDMEYVVDENVIIIRDKLQTVDPSDKELKVRGTVVDEKGEILSGVTVHIKGTNLGTVTDAKGMFMLRLPERQDIVLSFSFVGKQTKELKFAGQKEIKVVMYEDIQALEDVVVTGYQVIDKRKLTSAISTVKAEDLEKMGALTIDQMLEGKAPGLMIMNMSAQPGAATKIRVRAGGTFTGTREPLWVIDGVIYEDPVPLSAADINSLDNVNLIGNAITGLNPQDIAQIDILKDASATAIYGTRAANGVIVVTTKRGKEGSLALNYSGSVSIVDRPRYSDLNLMNSKERIDVSREIARRNLYYPSDIHQYVGYEGALKKYYYRELDYAGFQQEVARLETMNTDWFGELYRKAITHSHSVNMSGGNEKMRVYAGLNYDNQTGTEIHVGLYRVGGRINADFNLRKNILISLSLSGSVQKADYNHSAYSVFDQAYNMSRAVPAREENGELFYIDKSFIVPYQMDQYGKFNILNELANSRRTIWNKELNMRASVDWEIIKGLKIHSQFSFRNTSNIEEEWITDQTFYIAPLRTYGDIADRNEREMKGQAIVPFGGIYSNGSTSSEALSVTTQVNYNKSVAEKHHFNLNIGQEANTTSYTGASGWMAPGYNHEQGRSFMKLPAFWDKTSEYPYPNMVNWLAETSGVYVNFNGNDIYPRITDRKTNTLSFFGIFNYQFEDRYIFNFNIRSDGSNRFGQYQRYKFRPAWSTSFRWNLHSEGFMSGTESFLDEFAVRLSYGFRGTPPNTSPYLVIRNYGQNQVELLPEYVSSLSSFPNANLKWERTKTLNVGLNHSWFGGRISGAFDYAYSRSLDLLLSRPVSLVNGSATQMYNGGSKEDHTFEMNVLGQLIESRKFQWNVNVNITRVKEKVLRGFDGNVTESTILNFLKGDIYMKGFPLDGFYSYQFDKLDDKGLPTYKGFEEAPLDMDFTDVDSRTYYELLQKCLVYEGNRLPKFYGGFGTEFRYANFTLTANFTYKIGQKVRLLELYNGGLQKMPLPENNMSGEFNQRWRQPGDETIIPALSNEELMGIVSSYILPLDYSYWWAYDQSDVRTAKGSYIRWQTLTLNYNLPDRYVHRLGMSNVRFGFQVQNLGVLTFDKKLKGKDPEQVRSVGMPVLPSYNFSLDFSF